MEVYEGRGRGAGTSLGDRGGVAGDGVQEGGSKRKLMG